MTENVFFPVRGDRHQWCALPEMNDGKIEMLMEERDAARKDIEREGQSERYQ